MARAAIFLTLIAATLIGPCLCCCALNRVLGRTEPTAGADSVQQPASVGPTCPHCRPPAQNPTPKHPGHTAPSDPTHPCPHCSGQASIDAIAPTLVNHVVDDPFVALLPVTSFVSSTLEFAADQVEYPPGWGTQAFLLDACHRLRC
jgi:hypothetical protein